MHLFRPTFLYIKQHTVTGKLYFGKTWKRDPEIYLGSGTRWKAHIRKHGSSLVETVWYCLFTDKDDLVSFALQFSRNHNIVESDDWLNLVEENGLAGSGRPKSFSFSEDSKLLMSKARQGKPAANRGKPHSLEARQKMSASSTHKGKKLSAESIAKRTKTFKAKLVKRRKTICPHCGKEGSVGASMQRWHFDNCRLKDQK